MTDARSARPSRPLRLLATFLVAITVTGLVLAAYVVIAARSQGSSSDALMEASVDRSTLPVQLPLRELGGAFVVDATVGAAPGTPVSLMLDTGAPTTVLPDLADRVGGDPVGSVEEVTLDGVRTRRDIVPVGRLALGGATFDDVAAVEGSFALDHPIRCITDDGFLGADVMADAVWQIDPAAGRLVIAPSLDGLDHIEGALRLPFTPSTEASPSPIVELPTQTGRLRVVVDTGADGWLAVHPDDLDAAGGVVKPDAPARCASVWTSGPGPFTRIRYGSADVRLGERLVTGLPVATVDALMPGLGVLGTEFLRHFVLTVDWPGRAVYLDPVDPGGIDGLRPSPPLLATVGWDGHDLTVSSMVDVPEATDAGLAIGLPVRAIDGRDASTLSSADACALVLDPTGPFDLTKTDGTTVRIDEVRGFLGS